MCANKPGLVSSTDLYIQAKHFLKYLKYQALIQTIEKVLITKSSTLKMLSSMMF